MLARRVAVAAWRLERADRMEAEVLEFRSYEGANPGIALIRDGNGTRSFETLMRYRSAAMAEFWRALRTLKALQAEQAAPSPSSRPSAGAPDLSRRARARPRRSWRRPVRPSAVASRPQRAARSTPSRAPNEPCLAECGMEVGAHPVHGVGARGRRSERTQGP